MSRDVVPLPRGRLSAISDVVGIDFRGALSRGRSPGEEAAALATWQLQQISQHPQSASQSRGFLFIIAQQFEVLEHKSGRDRGADEGIVAERSCSLPVTGGDGMNRLLITGERSQQQPGQFHRYRIDDEKLQRTALAIVPDLIGSQFVPFAVLAANKKEID